MSPEKRVIPPQKSDSNHDSAQELCAVFEKMSTVFDGAANSNSLVKRWNDAQKAALKPSMVDLFTAIHYHANGSFRNVTTRIEEQEVSVVKTSSNRETQQTNRTREMEIMIYGERAGILTVPILNEREYDIARADLAKGAKSLVKTMLGFLQEGVTTQQELTAKSKSGVGNRLPTVRSTRFR